MLLKRVYDNTDIRAEEFHMAHKKFNEITAAVTEKMIAAINAPLKLYELCYDLDYHLRDHLTQTVQRWRSLVYWDCEDGTILGCTAELNKLKEMDLSNLPAAKGKITKAIFRAFGAYQIAVLENLHMLIRPAGVTVAEIMPTYYKHMNELLVTKKLAVLDELRQASDLTGFLEKLNLFEDLHKTMITSYENMVSTILKGRPKPGPSKSKNTVPPRVPFSEDLDLNRQYVNDMRAITIALTREIIQYIYEYCRPLLCGNVELRGLQRTFETDYAFLDRLHKEPRLYYHFLMMREQDAPEGDYVKTMEFALQGYVSTLETLHTRYTELTESTAFFDLYKIGRLQPAKP